MQPVGSKSSFPFRSLECERSAGETAHRCRYTGASVFEWRQKFCEPAARLDGLVNLRWHSNGLEGQIEPEIKRHGPTRVWCWCINASVTCDPRQNKKVKFDGARCPFSTFLRLQGDHHCACAQKWCHFSYFSKSFQTKKLRLYGARHHNWPLL